MKKLFTLIGGFALTLGLNANAEVITLYPQDFDNKDIANPSQSEISKDEEGNIIISDFLFSEAPVSFKFDTPEPDKSSDIIFTGYLDRSETFPYLMQDNEKFMTCWLKGYNGSDDWTPIYWPYVSEDGYSYVYRYDMTDPENEYEYFGSICLAGFNEDNSNFPWIYINFWFNDPGTNSVNDIESADSNKIEFFNLNGQRVDNPSNGIFIRKQGSKTSKVMIR